jgi:hypothetical protein
VSLCSLFLGCVCKEIEIGGERDVTLYISARWRQQHQMSGSATANV